MQVSLAADSHKENQFYLPNIVDVTSKCSALRRVRGVRPRLVESSSVLTAMEMPDWLLEGLVEGELGDMAEDGVEDEGLDLLLRGAEFVEGVVDLVVEDLVLDGDGDLDEDVVVSLGLDGELGLLDLEVDEVDALGEGDEDVEAGADDAVELAEALDYARGVGADGEEGFEDGEKNDDGENNQEEEQCSAQRLHVCRDLGSEDT